MVEVLLYHHAQGLTQGVEALAGELRKEGRDVIVPDLYEGATLRFLERVD